MGKEEEINTVNLDKMDISLDDFIKKDKMKKKQHKKTRGGGQGRGGFRQRRMNNPRRDRNGEDFYDDSPVVPQRREPPRISIKRVG